MTRFRTTTLIALAAMFLVFGIFGDDARWPAISVVLLCYIAVVAAGVAIMRLELFGRVFRTGAPGNRWVSLTFDDGPDPAATPALLGLLEDKGAHATFFCVGSRVERFPDIARRMVEEGHLIGNHTFSHSPFTNLYSSRRLKEDLERAQQAVWAAAGVLPRFFRPPMGLMNPSVASTAKRLGLDVVGWQAGRFDRGERPPSAVVRRIMRRLRDGGIVVLHDQGVAPERLTLLVDLLIDEIRARGLEVVPLDSLLGRDAVLPANEGRGHVAVDHGERDPVRASPREDNHVRDPRPRHGWSARARWQARRGSCGRRR